MVRDLVLSLGILVLWNTSAYSQNPREPEPRASRALAINAAMLTAKEHMSADRPAEAVAVLEAQLQHVQGNLAFLSLLKDCYIAYLKRLTTEGGSADRIDHVRTQLRILDPKGVYQTPNSPPMKSKPQVIESDVPSLIKPPEEPIILPTGAREPTHDYRAEGVEAFEQKRYAESATLFSQAHQSGVKLSQDERAAWAYCRLYAIATKLKQNNSSPEVLKGLEQDTEEAVSLGGEAVKTFGVDLLTAIRKRRGATAPIQDSALPLGWNAVESANFRVLYRHSKTEADETLRNAEMLRSAIFKKWSGPAGSDWTPKCDIHLHIRGDDYTKATGKGADSQGHSSVGIRSNVVAVRRIDLRLDDPDMVESTLPHEVAYVVVSDLFAEQPLPRWAEIGMTTLAQPAAQVTRYHRAVPRLTQERKLFSVGRLLKMPEYPDAAEITSFYVTSVSLVEYLVKLKGPTAFTLYLREAPRRGYEEALQRHYGIRDATELQERWLRSLQQ